VEVWQTSNLQTLRLGEKKKEERRKEETIGQKYTLCLKKRPTFTTCCNFYIHSSIATIFGTNVAQKVDNQNVLSIFPPHLTSASALPGEIGNLEIVAFHLNAACFFTKKT